ncbi:DUF2652 domain-containing protein [Microbacterium atlanticum]|uniref:DUF2652 domain-containing protein n=1 Tax=Microbacterium atlanticum TaxID=2782168 RepID=UPI0018888F2F|nr:DUF2652 domain-containing protein [Microbacterium atlanticum]
MTTTRTALIIADIGGYTQYMGSHRMSLAHAEVNTSRMLESIVRAARGFDLVEIEGDAAFLSAPTGSRAPEIVLGDIVRVAVAMHRAFHLEREYVVQNLCPCGGCREARDLKLKFVAHVGEVATQSIRGRSKLVGVDVIIVHRLLKNPVAIPEYLLLTDDLCTPPAAALPAAVDEISPDIEGIGGVHAYAFDVSDLDGVAPVVREATWRARLGSTFSAVGRGMPYMIGAKKPRRKR